MLKKIVCMLLIIAVLFGVFLVYSFFVEPNMLSVTYVNLFFENLPEEENGLKIAQISDLHYNKNAFIYEKTLKKLREINPDLIVITGDFIGSERNTKSVEYCKRIAELGIPVYAIMGNWDHNLFELTGFEKKLEGAGIRLLVNSNKEIFKNFFLAGTDDSFTGYADLAKTFSGIPQGAFVILLTHSPDIIYDAAKYKPALVLCGHTHGGQVKIPFTKKALYVPSIYGSRFLEGLFKVNGVYMYVNRGIGNSHLRMRFMSVPEITVFTLRKK